MSLLIGKVQTTSFPGRQCLFVLKRISKISASLYFLCCHPAPSHLYLLWKPMARFSNLCPPFYFWLSPKSLKPAWSFQNMNDVMLFSCSKSLNSFSWGLGYNLNTFLYSTRPYLRRPLSICADVCPHGTLRYKLNSRRTQQVYQPWAI